MSCLHSASALSGHAGLRVVGLRLETKRPVATCQCLLAQGRICRGSAGGHSQPDSETAQLQLALAVPPGPIGSPRRLAAAETKSPIVQPEHAHSSGFASGLYVAAVMPLHASLPSLSHDGALWPYPSCRLIPLPVRGVQWEVALIAHGPAMVPSSVACDSQLMVSDLGRVIHRRPDLTSLSVACACVTPV